jgi:hypothetical protein
LCLYFSAFFLVVDLFDVGNPSAICVFVARGFYLESFYHASLLLLGDFDLLGFKDVVVLVFVVVVGIL